MQWYEQEMGTNLSLDISALKALKALKAFINSGTEQLKGEGGLNGHGLVAMESKWKNVMSDRCYWYKQSLLRVL